MSRELGEEDCRILGRLGAEERWIPFEKFRPPEQFTWFGALFKLEALKYWADSEGDPDDLALLLDADCVIHSNLEDLWREASQALLLYETDHPLSHPQRVRLAKVGQTAGLGNEHGCPEHKGGELIAGTREHIRTFCAEIEYTWQCLLRSRGLEQVTQEHVVSLAADRIDVPIQRANKYLIRCWTTFRYRNVPENYQERCIWHLPAEKDVGLADLVRALKRNGQLPDAKCWPAILGLDQSPFGKLQHGLRRLKQKALSRATLGSCLLKEKK